MISSDKEFTIVATLFLTSSKLVKNKFLSFCLMYCQTRSMGLSSGQ